MTVYKLTPEEKNELRRLTQLANRRIKAFMVEYEKAGLSIIPKEVSGGIQTRQQWATEKYAISRSTKFANEEAFRAHLRWLRQFEKPAIRPTLTEYTKVQRKKTIEAYKTIMGDIDEGTIKKINKMSLAELTKFWQKFSDRARQLGLQYSSDAMAELMETELYEEDERTLMEG